MTVIRRTALAFVFLALAALSVNPADGDKTGSKVTADPSGSGEVPEARVDKSHKEPGASKAHKKDKAPPVAAAAAARAPGGKAGKGKKGKGKKGDAAAKKGKGKDGPKKAARKDPVAKGGKKSPRKKGPGEAKEKKKAGAGMARKGQKADRNQAHNKVLPGQDKVQSGASKPGKKSAPSPPSALGAMRAMFESDKPEFVANHYSAGQLAALAAAVVFVAAVATVIVFPQRLEQLKALRHLNQNAPMLHETTQFLGDRRSMTGADAMTEG